MSINSIRLLLSSSSTFFLAEIKTNIHDAGALKRVLDDTLVQYLNTQYVEDTALSNIKIGLSFFCVCVALTAQVSSVALIIFFLLLILLL